MIARFKTIILFLLVLTGVASAQTVYYVDGTVSSSGNGSSWNKAYKTVQEGINAASGAATTPASDTIEVWVKEGTYYIYVDSDENTINMAEGVMIYGGFNGTETKRDDRDWENNATILDGHKFAGSTQQVKHVVTAFGNEVATDTYESWSNGLIDGFTITGGEISVGGGGPVKGNSKATDPESILSSANESSGAGILIFKCGPNVSNCNIVDNSAMKGGGLYVVTATQFPTTGSEPKPEIYNCVISNNYALTRGGGLALDVGSEPTFINCKIQNNSCAAKGGGAYIDWVCPEPIFINCLFSGNNASRAGALGADGSSSPLLINCTVVNNSAEDVGAGFYTGSYNPDGTGSNDPTLINCIVYGNSCDWGGPTDIRIWHEDYFSISHSSIGEGFTSYGDGVIYQDPKIANAAGDDYTLSSSSPCINTGTASDALDANNLIPNYDINGNPRDINPDMGCYEFSGIACTSYTVTNNALICEGDSLFAAGAWQTVAGNYYDSLLTTDNCDSVIVTVLALNKAYNIAEDVSICSSGSYLLPNGTEVTDAGTYASNLTTTAGCDSIIITNLTVGEAYNLEQNASICNGETYTLPDGTEVIEEGNYTSTLSATDGCDSVIITKLTVETAINIEEEVSICYGSTYTFSDGTLADTSGTYVSIINTASGCDSIITTEVSLDSGYHVLEVIHICDGETFTLPDGREVSERGVYESVYTSISGCDSILVTRVETPPSYEIEANVTICTGGSFSLPDSTAVTAAGTYVANLTSRHGCDSIIIFNIEVGSAYIINEDVYLCEGESYVLPDGTVVSDTGMHENNFNATIGCDSIIRTHISYYATYSQTENVAICKGETYTLPDGNSASEAGSYISYLTTVDGCDSTVTSILTINPVDIVYTNAAICSGEEYILPNDSVATNEGNYYTYLSSANNCDSIVVTALKLKQEYEISQMVTICEGESYILPDGTTVTEAGEFTSTLTAVNFCDSVIITTVEIGSKDTITEHVGICEGASYTLTDGTEVSKPGEYTCTIETSTGCDSIIVTNLIIHKSEQLSEEVTICSGSYYVLPDGTEVSDAGTYESKLKTVNDCDSIITTTVIVNPAFETSEDVSICSGDSYTLPDGTVVSTEGSFTSSLETVTGCDSIIVTYLTLLHLPPAPQISQDGNSLSSDKAQGNQWFLNNQMIDGANQDTYVCLENGDYHAVLISPDGCSSEISNVINVILTALESDENAEMFVYPNPANNFIQLKGFETKTDNVLIDIYEIGGNLVYQDILNANNTLDLSGFTPGIYLVRIKYLDKVVNLRFIKSDN